MIIPHPLNRGDRVAILAPCSPVKPEFIQPAAGFIESLGYIPVLYKSCFCRHAYLAGEDSRRADDINQAFAATDIRAIIAIRGGYGGARLAKYLDYDIIRVNPKIFCGFSDVTVLHIMLNKFCDLATFHTPMPADAEMCSDEFTAGCLSAILSGNYPHKLVNATCLFRCVHKGYARGKITGGNLTVIASTVGTPYEIETDGRILFLEDVGECAYAVDRYLLQLRDSGLLQKCRGIILGTWQDCGADNELEQVFAEIFAPLNIPIIANLQCGHSVPSISIPMGFTAEIYAHEHECKILIDTP